MAIPTLFDAGGKFIEERTGLPCLGVVPHWSDASRLPAEDALVLDSMRPATITARSGSPSCAWGASPISMISIP